MGLCCEYVRSSIGKKQVVAATGLILILFLVGHLAGNLFIYAGPEAFNNYAKKLAHLRPGLLIVEFGLAAIFFIHMWFTALIVLENRAARPVPYAVSQSVGKRALATRLMPYTGFIIITFVVWHLIDFTFSDHHGVASILADGKSYGLYGTVYNAFANPLHSLLYIIAMMAIGFHLSHGVQSFAQTFGFSHPKYMPMIKKISNGFGIFIATAFSLIPIYIWIDSIR